MKFKNTEAITDMKKLYVFLNFNIIGITNLNYELFLARRFTTTKKNKGSISYPIIKIAISAIAIGIIMMLITVATGLGLQHKIREKISIFKGHLQIVNYDNNNSETTQNPISKNQNFYPKFEKIEGIKYMQVFASKAGIIYTEKDFEGIVLKGVSKDYNWLSIKDYIVEGKPPDIGDEITNKVLISKLLSDRMRLRIGERFDTYFMKGKKLPNRRIFTVCGIYNSGFKEFDEIYIFGDIKHIQRLNKWNSEQIGGFEVLLEEFENLKEKGNEIYKEIDPTLDSHTILELFPTIFEWLKLFDTNIYIIIAIMILVGGINMITALLVIILERTQTIGILKAFGSTNWSIRKIFLYNSSYLILRGLLFGNIIGLSALFIQKYFGIIALDSETYYVDKAPIYINFWHVLLLNVGTIVLCILMILIPSHIITKITPTKAMKFE